MSGPLVKNFKASLRNKITTFFIIDYKMSIKYFVSKTLHFLKHLSLEKPDFMVIASFVFKYQKDYI